MKITIPQFSLITLIGVSGSGKSTFARKHFKQTEVLSSDYCRGLVCCDENDQVATKDAFEVLHFIAAKRLALKKLTVIDATNVQQEARKPILDLARSYHCMQVAIVFNLPRKVCEERNRERQNRNFGSHVLRNQASQLKRSLKSLKREGYKYVHVFNSEEEVENVEIVRNPLWTDKTYEKGPFDIIGDVHGCYDELRSLLDNLGYRVDDVSIGLSENAVTHPDGRRLIFVGDLVDRGPKTPEVLSLVMNIVGTGTGFCVPGNHDVKLLKYLRGKNVQMKHGLCETVESLEKTTSEFKEKVAEFINGLVSHYVFDEGKLVVAHAGMKESMYGRASGKVRTFALFGETTGEVDEFGLPVRYNWAAEYRGKATVVYGHTPVPEPEWLNNTICLDTGCAFGGKLTALRYPERELISVPAAKQYYEPAKPLIPEDASFDALSAQQEHDDVLDLQDVLGKRIISTRFNRNITIRAENANAALEVISRYSVNPKWLIYLPPTMSPSETSKEDGLLEHPLEAFDYYQKNGMPKIVCEEKHMGSRAVIVLCKDEEATRKRFGILNEGIGACYTRTGRPFFENKELEQELLMRILKSIEKAGLWDRFETDWACLDCEIMPWSMKAKELLKQQYAATGSAAKNSIAAAVDCLEVAKQLNGELGTLLELFKQKADAVEAYINSYRNYCWDFSGIGDLKVAPFHILATEGVAHVDKDHEWHMKTIKEFCEYDQELLIDTPMQILDMNAENGRARGISWWEALTEAGGEGMVVKPYNFIAKGKRGLLQPAVKCRGREYLRIIYGPEYTLPDNLARLRERGLATKRSLAIREFALGVESLERFVRREPLRRVHECVFGVLALESEPVDPRL
jgi:protein phosphatase